MLAQVAAGITPEMAAAVSKIMRNQDLITVAKKCRVVTRFRNTIGLPGHLSVRLQPNHPTDSLQGIAAHAGRPAGRGDAVVGINPASDSLPLLEKAQLHAGRRNPALRHTHPSCVLTHVTNTLRLMSAAHRWIWCFSRSPVPKRPSRLRHQSGAAGGAQQAALTSGAARWATT